MNNYSIRVGILIQENKVQTFRSKELYGRAYIIIMLIIKNIRNISTNKMFIYMKYNEYCNVI